MQTRLLASLVGGLLGAALASSVNARLDLAPLIGFIACPIAGVLLGWVVSQLFDVFTKPSGGRINLK
jgi:predicted Kef-type K+ transport protein